MIISNKEKKMWYLSYGSNIDFDRFKLYIEGGVLRSNQKEYKGCNNKTLPLNGDIYNVIVNGKIFFANKSQTWGLKGVAFFNPRINDYTLGKMYSITERQLEEVHDQEGKSEKWYPDIVKLGEYKNQDIVTITSTRDKKYILPTIDYVETISSGIKNSFDIELGKVDVYMLNALTNSTYTTDENYMNTLNMLVSEYYEGLLPIDRKDLVDKSLEFKFSEAPKKIDLLLSGSDVKIKKDLGKVKII